MKRISELPFNPDRKYMLVQYKEGYYVKGASEAIIPLCDKIYIDQQTTKPLDKNDKLVIEKKAKKYAEKGLRIIFFAFGVNEKSFTLIGFAAMSDPPKENVTETIEALYSGGVRVIMITGDSSTFIYTFILTLCRRNSDFDCKKDLNPRR
jgi:Ca2+-transporting ATPase